MKTLEVVRPDLILFLILLAPSLRFTMSNAETPDDFFLNFGSSSNVCDQLRHSIRQEVTEIDASIIKIEEESRKEERTSQEMAKSIVHARKEMYNLRRFAHDMVESTNMNETLRVRMMEDLQTELVRPYLLKREGDKNAVEKLMEDGDADDPSSPTCVTFLEDRQAKIHLLLTTHSKSKADALAIFEAKRELEDAKSSIERRMVTEKLEEKVKLAQIEIKELSTVLENEQRRLRISKEAVHEARTQSGKHAQEIANYVSASPKNEPSVGDVKLLTTLFSFQQTKTLTMTKAKHEEERKELAALLTQEQEELVQLQRADDVEKKLREVTHHVQLLMNQNEEAVDARKRRAQIVACIDSAAEEVAQLEMDAIKAENEIARKLEAVTVASKQLDDANFLQEQALAQKAHNDRIHTDKIVPGQLEFLELKKSKELLVKGIHEMHSTMETQLKQLKDDVELKGAVAERLLAETNAVVEENEKSVVALAQIKRAREELLQSTERECEENRDIASKFLEACDAETTRRQDFLAEKKAHREQTLNDVRTKALQNRQELEEKFEVYMRAIDMMKDVRSDELELATLEKSLNHG